MYSRACSWSQDFRDGGTPKLRIVSIECVSNDLCSQEDEDGNDGDDDGLGKEDVCGE
jgi:hypothetical protein